MFCLLCVFFVFLVFTNVGGRGMPDSALKLWDGRVELFILRTNLRKDLSDNLYFCETMPDQPYCYSLTGIKKSCR